MGDRLIDWLALFRIGELHVDTHEWAGLAGSLLHRERERTRRLCLHSLQSGEIPERIFRGGLRHRHAAALRRSRRRAHPPQAVPNLAENLADLQPVRVLQRFVPRWAGSAGGGRPGLRCPLIQHSRHRIPWGRRHRFFVNIWASFFPLSSILHTENSFKV